MLKRTVNLQRKSQYDFSAKLMLQKALSFFGYVDICCLSSGLGIRAFNDTITPEVEKQVLQTNYLGPILLAKAILPSMRSRREGTIVFISSIQGLLAVPGRTSYSGAKHALQGYCDSLRAEEVHNNVHVLTVSPAYVKYVNKSAFSRPSHRSVETKGGYVLNSFCRTNHSIHSIRGDGNSYNQMDATTQKGMDPADLAKQIRKAVIERKGNLIVAPLYMKMVNVLQYIAPGAVSWYMSRKAKNTRSTIHV